jgi:hypothetical protein
MTKPKRYVAVCGRCYSCVLAETNSKRTAATACTSHMNAYYHETWVRDRQEQPDVAIPEPVQTRD